MSVIAVIAVIVFILLVAIWLIHVSYRNDILSDTFRDHYESLLNKGQRQYDKYFASPAKLYNKTIGYEFDENTHTALDKAEKLEIEYRKKEKTGITEQELRKAASNAALIGDIYRFNVAPNIPDKTQAKKRSEIYYNRAINRIITQPQASVEGIWETDILPPEFIIDRVETFYQDQNVVPVHLNQVREVVRKARKDKKKMGFDPPEVVIPSDTQNVHDPEVNHELKQKYETIKTHNERERGEYTLKDIEEELIKHKFDNLEAKNNARKILWKIAEKGELVNLNASEDEVLLAVWKRIHSQDNQEQRQALKESLFDALANSMEKGYLGNYSEVCAGGRCARILGSLTLLDNNKELSQPLKTTHILKEEIFNRSRKIIEESLKGYDQRLVDAYNGKIDYQTDIGKLEEDLKVAIERELRKEYSHIKAEVLDNIIKDAQAGV